MFKKSDVIERVIKRCITSKTWRSECEREVLGYVQKGEDKRAAETLVREAYDAAGAGFSGRWQ